ncbi:MAG: cobalamin-dependent protein [Dehalococcoidales bacterium]|nr:MAG: cobalamin-dependent protein [Dehalococcoidales bacterium]
MPQAVLLINTNVTQPPVSPVGLEYVGEALIEANLPVRVLDLALENDWKSGLARELAREEPLIVGLTVRNTDDCSFATRKSFIPWITEVTTEVKRLTSVPILLGGVGFSVMPKAVLRLTGADIGIAGDGEEVVPALARCLIDGKDISHLPNLVYRQNGNIICNRRANVNPELLPLPRRHLFDNRRYEELGAIVGIETKRGCPKQCIYCADPVAKGASVRLRPTNTVVQEFRDLLTSRVSWFHLCDSEFNQPLPHAKAICRAIIEAGLGDSLHWYSYCSPVPFDLELAMLMKRAGCTGINFGIDSLCDEQLLRLGRSHSVDDIQRLTRILERAELDYMFDLIVGGPSETPATIATTVEVVKKQNVPLVGIATGMRVYPGTPLSRDIANGTIREGLHPKGIHEFHEPAFYLSPRLGDDPFQLVHELVDGDPRFLLLVSPDEEESYNYTDDQALCQMIEDGARGAYWHILSKNRGQTEGTL